MPGFTSIEIYFYSRETSLSLFYLYEILYYLVFSENQFNSPGRRGIGQLTLKLAR